MTRQRFAWLATCALFVACASGPTSSSTRKRHRDDSELGHKKRKKKKRKKHRKVDVAERADDDEVRIIDDEDVDGESGGVFRERRRDRGDDDDDEDRRDRREREEREAREEREERRGREERREREDRREREEREREREERAERERREREREERAEREREEREREREERAERERRARERKREARREARRRKREKDEEARLAARRRRAQEEDEDDDEDDRRARRERERPVEVAEAEPAVIDMSEQDETDVIEMDDEEPPIRRVAAIPVPGVDDDEEDEDELPEELPPGAMPLAINRRPLIRPKDKLAVHAGLRVDVLTLPDPVGGMDTSTTTKSLALGASYGVSDKLEVGADYAPSLSPGSAKGPFTLHGTYLVIHESKLDVALAAGLAIDFDAFTDPTTMETTTRTLASLQLGAWARYRLTPKASLFSGVPAVPATTASVSKLSFALPPLPYQLAIGLQSGGTIALDLPVGIGYQAKPKIYALAMLDLAHLRIANTQNAFLFKDFIPIMLGGFYSLEKIDVGALFSDDLEQGTDYLRFEIVARYSLK